MKSLRKRQTRKSNVKQSTRKKVTRKAGRKVSRNGVTGSTNRKSSPKRKRVKRAKPIKKVVVKIRLRRHPIHKTKSRRSTARKTQATRVTGAAIVRHKRTKQTIDISFKGVRAITKKVDLIVNSDKLYKDIQQQLTHKGGKPPKGFVIVVSDKEGRQAGEVSHPTMLVNAKNIRKTINSFLNKLKRDNSKYRQSLADHSGDIEAALEENPYGNYNPNTIDSISVIFVY